MWKIGVVVIILILIMVADVIFFSRKYVTVDSQWKGYRIIRYKLHNKSYKFLVADTSEKWTKGLMYVRKLQNLDGMIFIFPNSQVQSFWNENTLVDLDIYWINKDKVVGKTLLPSIEKSKSRVIVTSPGPVDTVVEFIRKT